MENAVRHHSPFGDNISLPQTIATTKIMKILHAYCRELADTVSIDVARRSFICEEPALDKYHFFCDDPHCGKETVRISGVNYRDPAEDIDKYVAAHYRKLDEHHPECDWVKRENDEAIELLPGESEEEATQRRLRRKLSDLVNYFDPPSDKNDKDGPAQITAPQAQGGAAAPEGDQTPHQQGTASNARGDIRTSSLERLVETYREAKANLSESEFRALEITIARQGKMKLGEYFCRIARTSFETRDRVIFGGAWQLKRYGTGFSLRFYDDIDKKPVSLYISKDQMNEYRYRRHVEYILSKDASVRYFTVYAIGHLEPGKKEGAINLIVNDLRNLVITPGKLKSVETATA